jgi:PAS domain S-box-containing protein
MPKRTGSARNVHEGRFEKAIRRSKEITLLLTSNAVILEANRAAQYLLEAVERRVKREVVGQPLSRFFTASTHAKLTAWLRGTPHTQRLELPLSLTDGSILRVSLTAAPAQERSPHIAVILSVDSKASTTNSSSALSLEPELQYGTLLNHTVLGIGLTDLHGNIVFVNDRLYELLGLSTAVLPKFNILSLTLQGDESGDAALLEGLLREGNPFCIEKRHVRPSGESVWISSSVSLVRDQAKRPKYIQTVTQDITERKRTEARLLEVNEAQKRFVSDAAHELRAPLTAIRGNLELLRRYPNVSMEEQRQMIGDAELESERLSRLIGHLLSLARGDAGMPIRRDFVQLDVVLAEAWRSVYTLTNRHRLQLGSLAPCSVVGDRDRLKQLVVTLLENAVKYTPDGGEVRLEQRCEPDWVEVRVADTGQGIAPEDLPHVFERFYRADKSRTRGMDSDGAGLGLPIAQWIARAHAGDIRLESEFGRGTTAIVRLPRVPTPAESGGQEVI